MYKVYRISKTPLVEGSKGHEYISEFWNPEAAEQAAAKMELRPDEKISIEYTKTLEESIHTDYFD